MKQQDGSKKQANTVTLYTVDRDWHTDTLSIRVVEATEHKTQFRVHRHTQFGHTYEIIERCADGSPRSGWYQRTERAAVEWYVRDCRAFAQRKRDELHLAEQYERVANDFLAQYEREHPREEGQSASE